MKEGVAFTYCQVILKVTVAAKDAGMVTGVDGCVLKDAGTGYTGCLIVMVYVLNRFFPPR